ncbi:hypothetical protein B0H14DRAFT_2365668 [Mycena olivaceomarginata]|nr:hypothetical protein B0H14DRAFT_2365668 [Mycena olivaceomarginata]
MPVKTHTWVFLWFLLTALVCCGRSQPAHCGPRSMEGGDLHWFWAAYSKYQQVYGVPSFKKGDGFPNAQALLNVVEMMMNLVYLYTAHVTAWLPVPLGFTVAAITLSKTLLYWAQEYFCNFCAVGHNSLEDPMIAPLFTETGIIPLRVCRLLLVLNHLRYFLGRKDDHYARTALNSSIELAEKGKKSWVSDVTKAITRLPFVCPEFVLTRQTTDKEVETYAKLVRKLMLEWLQDEIDSFDKLYLLHGRLEPQKEKSPTQVTSCMQHHLTMVKTQKH